MRAVSVVMFVAVCLGAGAAHRAEASNPPGSDAGSAIAADVDAAGAGLKGWLAANKPASPSSHTDIAGCPALELDSLQTAFADSGLPGELADWSTDILWDELEGISPNLMGIACAADVDGDSRDDSFGPRVKIYAVDAGDDEGALEVLQYFGFGALSVVEADVPGGEIDTGCVTDGFGACLSFWNNNGMVFGVEVAADDGSILPADIADRMIERLLGDLLATLAAAPSEQAASGSGPSDSLVSTGDPSRDGLQEILATTSDTDDLAPTDPCRLADNGSVGDAFEVAGIDATLSGWAEIVGPIVGGRGVRQVACIGDYIGATGDDSFPELTATLFAADFGNAAAVGDFIAQTYPGAVEGDEMPTGDAGGATVGQCTDENRTKHCVELWVDGSFVVGIDIVDQIFIDRPTASAVLNELVPVVQESLAAAGAGTAESAASAASSWQLDPGVVEDAAIGFAGFVAANAEADDVDCVAVAAGDVEAALADTDVDQAVDGWGGRLAPVRGDAEDPPLGLTCRDSAEAVSVVVIDFANVARADDFVASVSLAEGGSGSDLDPNTFIVGGCTAAAGQDYCGSWWRQDGLVVGVTLFGASNDVGESDTADVLTALLPNVIGNLSAVA